MVFVEERKRNGRTYYYAVKTIREKDKVKKQSRFLGTDLNEIQLEKLFADAKVELGELDFENILDAKEKREFDELKDKLTKTIRTIEPSDFYQHFLTEFTYDSNAIEGSSLTLQETGTLLFEGISPKNKPMKHVQEAKNHKEAFDFITTLKQGKLDQKTICKIQYLVVKKTLLPHLQPYEGKIRVVNVTVGGHIAPAYYSVPRKLGSLIKWFNANREKYHPIVIAAYFHSHFEYIHPFVDGNGRTGRLLMNFMLAKQKYPLIILFNKYRLEYYAAMDAAQMKKNLKPLIQLMKKSYSDMLRTYTPKE